MGILRVFLALTVCVNHYAAMPEFGLHFLFGPGSRLAVEIFFILSGFSMALVLDDKYAGPGGVRLFYTNRLLRLYPVYFVALALYAVFNLALRLETGHWIFAAPLLSLFDMAQPLGKVWIAAANLVILGQDALLYVGVQQDTGAFCLNCPGAVPGFLALALPQAWTIEVELCFYLLAPLAALWSSRRLAFWTICFLAVKMLLYAEADLDEFWQFRFAPASVGLFLLGMLAYRVYRTYEQAPLVSGWTGKALCAGFIACLLAFPWLPGSLYLKAMLCYPRDIFVRSGPVSSHPPQQP